MSQKFNILFDYSIFFHQSVGGISRYITGLHNKLFNNGFDTEILSPIHQNKFLKEINTCKINRFVSHFPKNTLSICKTYNELITNIYLKFKKPNIFHKTFYNGNFPLDKKVKKVINVYDLIHEKFYNMYKKNEQFKCPDCNKMFSSKPNMRRHQLHRCKENTKIKELVKNTGKIISSYKNKC